MSVYLCNLDDCLVTTGFILLNNNCFTDKAAAPCCSLKAVVCCYISSIEINGAFIR